MHVQNLMNSLWDIRIFLGLVPKESHCTISISPCWSFPVCDMNHVLNLNLIHYNIIHVFIYVYYFFQNIPTGSLPFHYPLRRRSSAQEGDFVSVVKVGVIHALTLRRLAKGYFALKKHSLGGENLLQEYWHSVASYWYWNRNSVRDMKRRICLEWIQ